MNFGRRGIRSRQDYLASKSRKRMKKIILGISHLLLVGVIGLCVVGVSLGIGVFRGVIDSTPNQTVIDVSRSWSRALSATAIPAPAIWISS